MASPAPATRRYYNQLLDSGRWDDFTVRPGDVVVATAYKAGTTWTQNIVLHLIFQDLEVRHIGGVSPWLDKAFRDHAEHLSILEPQAHRRVIKSHMYFDGLPIWPEDRYIHVGRDPRDVFMSLWNFYSNFGDEMFQAYFFDLESGETSRQDEGRRSGSVAPASIRLPPRKAAPP